MNTETVIKSYAYRPSIWDHNLNVELKSIKKIMVSLYGFINLLCCLCMAKLLALR
jgi:hypothetical protein